MEANTQSVAMRAFINSNPQLANVAQQRDKGSKAFFGEAAYERYEQGGLKVITLRANSVGAGQPAVPRQPQSLDKGSKRYCSICSEDVTGFIRHNRAMHIKEPTQIFFCPVGTCNFTVHGQANLQIDEHLANAHQDFRNIGGRGGELLEHTTAPTVLSHLSKPAAFYVLEEDCLKAEAILEEKARLLRKLQQHNVVLPALEREFPADLEPGSVNDRTDRMTKAEMVTLIVRLRVEMKEWYAIFIEAEAMVEPGGQGHQDVEDDSTGHRSSEQSEED